MNVGRVERVIGMLGDLDPVMVLNATPLRVGSVIEGLLPGDEERRSGPGARDIRHILAHLADVELVTGVELRRVLSAPGSLLHPLDPGSLATRYAQLEPSLAAEAFRGLRAWNLGLLATLGLDDWLAEGVHPQRGRESVDLMVRLLAGHDIEQLMELDGALGR